MRICILTRSPVTPVHSLRNTVGEEQLDHSIRSLLLICVGLCLSFLFRQDIKQYFNVFLTCTSFIVSELGLSFSNSYRHIFLLWKPGSHWIFLLCFKHTKADLLGAFAVMVFSPLERSLPGSSQGCLLYSGFSSKVTSSKTQVPPLLPLFISPPRFTLTVAPSPIWNDPHTGSFFPSLTALLDLVCLAYPSIPSTWNRARQQARLKLSSDEQINELSADEEMRFAPV